MLCMGHLVGPFFFFFLKEIIIYEFFFFLPRKSNCGLLHMALCKLSLVIVFGWNVSFWHQISIFLRAVIWERGRMVDWGGIKE